MINFRTCLCSITPNLFSSFRKSYHILFSKSTITERVFLLYITVYFTITSGGTRHPYEVIKLLSFFALTLNTYSNVMPEIKMAAAQKTNYLNYLFDNKVMLKIMLKIELFIYIQNNTFDI